MMKSGSFFVILTPGNKASTRYRGAACGAKRAFEAKTMLCVWWNFEGPVYWELVSQGRTVDGTLYAEQLQLVYDIVRRRYPALVNRKRLLLQLTTLHATGHEESARKLRPWMAWKF